MKSLRAIRNPAGRLIHCDALRARRSLLSVRHAPAVAFGLALMLVIVGVAAVRAAGPEPDGGKVKRKNSSDGEKKSGGASASSPEALKRATKAVRSGDYETARSMIKAAFKATHSTKVKQAWQIVESEMEFGLKHYARSGLIAMRIVILTPDSEQVPAALYRAGKVYEKLGRPAKALELYTECSANGSTGESLKKKADRRISALKSAE